MHAHKLRCCNSPSRQHRHRRRRNLVNSSTLILHEAARRTRNGLPAAAWMFVAAKYHADLTALREKLEETFWQSNYSDEVSLLLFLSHCEHRRNTYKCVLNTTEDRRPPGLSGEQIAERGQWSFRCPPRAKMCEASSPKGQGESAIVHCFTFYRHRARLL